MTTGAITASNASINEPTTTASATDMDILSSYIPLLAQRLDFIDFHAKYEDVLFSHFLHHLNIGTVKSADRQSTIQLHMQYTDCHQISTLQIN